MWQQQQQNATNNSDKFNSIITVYFSTHNSPYNNAQVKVDIEDELPLINSTMRGVEGHLLHRGNYVSSWLKPTLSIKLVSELQFQKKSKKCLCLDPGLSRRHVLTPILQKFSRPVTDCILAF